MLKPFKTFSSAVRAMPEACAGNFDALSMTTIKDLAYCARHELDLCEEGEETDIKTTAQAAAVRRFLERCRLSA